MVIQQSNELPIVKEATPLEAWLIKRATVGLDNGNLMDYSICDPVYYLLCDLQRTPPKERPELLNQRLTKDVMREVVKVDPNHEAPKPEPIQDTTSRWKIIHVDELKKLPKAHYLVEPFIIERGLSVLYGASGTFKSFSALDMSLQVSQSQPVLYVVYEGLLGYRQRVDAWCNHYRRKAGHLYMVIGQLSVMDNTDMDKFLHLASEIKPALVVIDTVARAMTGSDENSTRDMGMFVSACERIQMLLGSAVLVVHHTSKQGIQERGSGALRGAADVMIKQTLDDATIVVECEKSKDAEPFDTLYKEALPVEVDIDGDIVSIPVLVDANNVIQVGDRLTKNQRKILDALNMDIFKEGATAGELSDMLPEIPRTSQYRTINKLMNMGLVSQEDKRTPYKITEEGMLRLSRLLHISTDLE